MIESYSRLAISCRYTGIVGNIDLPKVEGRNAVLHYTHPLSHIDSVLEVVEEGVKYMRRLDTTILSGMYLTILRHIGALKTKQDAAFLNAEISKAGKGALLHCTRALSSYVIPLAKVNKKIGMVQVTLELPLESKSDARLWLGSVTESLLQECMEVGHLEQYVKGLVNADVNTQYVSPYAFAAKQDMQEALKQREAIKQQMQLDGYAKAEALRAKKKERAVSFQSAGGYATSDLTYNESIDSCVVELHIANSDISSTKIAEKLCATFTRERTRKVQGCVEDHTNSALITISKSLSIMSCSKLETLYIKLSDHEQKEELATLARIVELLILNMQSVKSSVDILEDLGTAIQTEAVAKPMGLKERLATMKAAKENNNAD